METLHKGMIHILSGMGQNGRIFHYATQNRVLFKTYELFYFWNVPLSTFRPWLIASN